MAITTQGHNYIRPYLHKAMTLYRGGDGTVSFDEFRSAARKVSAHVCTHALRDVRLHRHVHRHKHRHVHRHGHRRVHRHVHAKARWRVHRP